MVVWECETREIDSVLAKAVAFLGPRRVAGGGVGPPAGGHLPKSEPGARR
jgi:hypothetical protein